MLIHERCHKAKKGKKKNKQKNKGLMYVYVCIHVSEQYCCTNQQATICKGRQL